MAYYDEVEFGDVKDEPMDKPLKIAIIGSTHYLEKFLMHKKSMEERGHTVRIPALDDHKELDDLGVCEYNRQMIRWADRVDIIWDQRSMGTLFDFGMAFMSEKPICIIYLEPKTFKGVMEKYEAKMWDGLNG